MYNFKNHNLTAHIFQINAFILANMDGCTGPPVEKDRFRDRGSENL